MKVIIGHFGHEANTFAEHSIGYEEYIGRGITFGEESIRQNEGLPTYLGGIIRACREEGVEMIPTCAYTCAAPVLNKECVDRMLEAILPVCEAHKEDVDGICIALHGAGVCEYSDDLESYVLKKIRAIVGNRIPITVPLDLHGNITREMAELTQGLFGIWKYPHVDKAEASYLAMKTLCRIMRGELETEVAVERIPLLIPISKGLTANAPFPEVESYFLAYAEKENLVCASFLQGFPYADVPEGTASVVVTAPKGGRAKESARHLAEFVWSFRNYWKSHSISPAQAMDLAEHETGEGYIVINEMSDNPGGGCPGDGTHLLREMIRRNLPGSIFGYMVDPQAVEAVFEHRPGDCVDLSLGGKHEKIFGDPLWLENAKILSMSDGNFRHTSPNLKGLASKLGKCARIQVGNVEIVIGSVRNQTFDDRPFVVTGADLNQYRYVGLKSTQHFRGYFADRALKIISTDPPGLNTEDLTAFEYKKIPRPVFPLDEAVFFS